MRQTVTFILILSFYLSFAQNQIQPPATSADTRLNGFDQRQELISNSLIRDIRFDNIGPTVFSGRVTDIEVNPEDPTQFYVAYASGGLWFTGNNGTTFEPLFDNEAVMTIGDIAIDWERDVIWLGSGENNSSRSSYAGTGMYRSDDHGKTWIYSGLPESHHIGRIILHPTDRNTIYVAVTGHLYSPNEERGIYVSRDNGISWERTLFVNENCGAIDLVIHPSDPDKLYAAMWERTRRAWNFVESGNGSGIYLSEDGGTNWELLTDEQSGFPTGNGVGRIGLDIIDHNGETMIYAILDNYFRRPLEETEETDELTKDALREMTKSEFLELDSERIAEFLDQNGFPEEYTAESVTEMVQNDEIQPVALVEYLENANALLFETDVIGAEVYMSKDDGSTWVKTHEGYIERLYNTYGYYFGQIRIAPDNPDKLYILGVPILRSDDGGKSWASINGANVHADHHALWIDPAREGHLVLGNDGGINISYDDGENWIKSNSPSVGQFYYVHLDRAKPYRVYGGLQDNGVWGGAHTYRGGVRWHSTGSYEYKSYLGGDGMQVQVDYRDNNTMYTGFQFGNYFRIDMSSGERKYITPQHKLGQRPFRWNWQTPIIISRHQQDIIYMGSNFLHRSLDQGESFDIISQDLTQGGRKGDVPYGTIATIHESPLKFGLIYTGSDDGLVYVTKDMGAHWTNISAGLPQDMWISRVRASAHVEGRVYCALNGYRWDDFNSYIYVSEDFGQTWTSIGDNLPPEPVNVIKEDPNDASIIYVGTDHGLYISIDQGNSYHSIGSQLPATPIHDLEVHPDEKDLVLATHGRSFYLADISPIYQIANLEANTMVQVLVDEKITRRHSNRWGRRSAEWSEYFTPEVVIPYYVSKEGKVEITIMKDDIELYSGNINSGKGLNYLSYDLTVQDKYLDNYKQHLSELEEDLPETSDNGHTYLPPDDYTVRITVDDKRSDCSLEIK